MSAASGGNSEPKQGQRSQSARGFCPRCTMRVPQPDIIEHFGNADAVPQPPERCLSRQAGIVRCCHRNRKRHVLTSLKDGAHAFSFLVPCASFHLQPGKVPAGSGGPALPLYFPVNRPMSPSRAQYFPQKFPISHPATGQFSTLTTFFADNFSCLRSVFHYLCKIITRYFVIYSCAILQL